MKDSGSLASSGRWAEPHLPPGAVTRFGGDKLRPNKVPAPEKHSPQRPPRHHSGEECGQVPALLHDRVRTQRGRGCHSPRNWLIPAVAPQHSGATRPGSLPHSGLGTQGTACSPGQLTLLEAQAQARVRAVGGAKLGERHMCGLGTTAGHQPGLGGGGAGAKASGRR